MNRLKMLLLGAAALPVCLFAQEINDTVPSIPDRELDLNEVVVVARRPVLKQQDGKLVYLVKNDPYAKGLDGVTILDRIPRVSVNNGIVSVAGKGNVRYIIDGILMELDATAMAMRLQNLRAEDIEKIELLITPPSRYAAEPNAVYISITLRNETLGTKGSVYGSLNHGNKLREYFSGSMSHTAGKWDMSIDASVSNYYNTNDKDMAYSFFDGSSSRISSTQTESHLFDAGVNALFRYKFTPDMNLGVIANFNYESVSNNGTNYTEYGEVYTSSSRSHTKSKPNNALTITGFYDWKFGAKGESVQLTYNYFNRHSPSLSDITTTYSNDTENHIVNEDGKTIYRFHSGKADFKLPYRPAQIEAGVAYTDILNSSCNFLNKTTANGSGQHGESNIFDYSERIAAAYITASRTLGSGFRGKIGLRYEYTFTKGVQQSAAYISRDRYGYLFPTFNLSWNKGRIGTFNISYSMGMGRPNLWELNPFKYYSTTDEYAAGNPALKPTVYNNAEINYYGLGGLYAVLYTSFASDAIGYIRRFDGNGTISTLPYNCLSTNKTGMYASYKRTFFDRWEMKIGGEVFRSYAHSDVSDFKIRRMEDWSGKLEVSTNVFLDRPRTLIFAIQFTHFFPWQQNLINYESFQLFNCSLRYSLLHNRLSLRLKANDIFGWNKTRSKEHYANYTIRQTFNAHPAYLLLGISYRFGRDKVNSVWRPSKEDQPSRTK